MKGIIFSFIMAISFTSLTQEPFLYDVEINPITIPNLPGLHSYAFASQDSLCVFIGGRRDGLHARQPFNAFPESYNNDSIFVVDLKNLNYWSKELSSLPSSISEQLQSSNMVFYQDADTLIMIGGYAYSTSAAEHKTFASLVTVNVNQLIDSVINNNDISNLFKQFSNDFFAVTGGQLGKIDDTFLLVGGHRFDGAYNPMGNPTYVQTYTNAIRKFKLNNSNMSLIAYDFTEYVDAQNLHRRDYNLMPYNFLNGDVGYLISSGVFQTGVDLPFLYPVEISASSVYPITTFDQKLSNYHSAKASLYDSLQNQTSMLFFGGMSSYYYDGSTLVYDSQVPFVSTVSLVIRSSLGTFHEYKLPVEMPQLHGSSAEFIPNKNLMSGSNEVLNLPQSPHDTILIGHIYGGIYSPSLNPFSNNQTNVTSASNVIYEVKLIYNPSLTLTEVPSNKVSDIRVYPNPIKNKFIVEYDLLSYSETKYVIANANGEIVQEGEMIDQQSGINSAEIKIERSIKSGTYILTLIFDNRITSSCKIIIE